MARKVRIKLNRSGVRQLLNSDGVLADLDARAERIKQAAGDGFEVAPAEQGSSRARAAVYTKTYEAMVAEAEDHTLTRAIDAGRG